MKRYICFCIVILMFFLLAANVMAEEIKYEKIKYEAPSYGEDGSLYFDVVTNGKWEDKGNLATTQTENMRAIFIGNNYGSTYLSNLFTTWEGSYGWEDQSSVTGGSTAKFYTLDSDRAISVIDNDTMKLRLTFGFHDRYYDADYHDNYFGFLGGSEVIVNFLSGLFYFEGSFKYSLYATDKAGDDLDILKCKAKLITESGLTVGYRYSFYKNEAGVRHSTSGMTLGFTFL
jgi:hypothetical protein